MSPGTPDRFGHDVSRGMKRSKLPRFLIAMDQQSALQIA
jgi:hypothetical protein